MMRFTTAAALIILSTAAFVRADPVDVAVSTAVTAPITFTDLATIHDINATVETRAVDQTAALPGSTDMALMGLGVVGMLFRRLRP